MEIVDFVRRRWDLRFAGGWLEVEGWHNDDVVDAES